MLGEFCGRLHVVNLSVGVQARRQTSLKAPRDAVVEKERKKNSPVFIYLACVGVLEYILYAAPLYAQPLGIAWPRRIKNCFAAPSYPDRSSRILTIVPGAFVQSPPHRLLRAPTISPYSSMRQHPLQPNNKYPNTGGGRSDEESAGYSWKLCFSQRPS